MEYNDRRVLYHRVATATTEYETNMKCVEESSELIGAVAVIQRLLMKDKYINDGDIHNVIDEIADFIITFEKVAKLDILDMVLQRMEYKLDRLEKSYISGTLDKGTACELSKTKNSNP